MMIMNLMGLIFALMFHFEKEKTEMSKINMKNNSKIIIKNRIF